MAENKLIDKKVVILYGGLSTEREVSLKSGKNIADSLSLYYSFIRLVDVSHTIVTDLQEIKPDICVIALHGTYGEDGTLQGLLETLRIPYTGSGVAASAICFDKLLTKMLLIGSGINTPRFVLAERNMVEAPFYPCVVKPSRQGSSVGVHIVEDNIEFIEALKDAFKYDNNVLIEEFIVGDEITIPIMGEEVFPPILIKPKKGFYDYDNKYLEGMTEYLLDTALSQNILDKLDLIVLDIYKVIGCRSMARIDFIVRASEIYCIEVNTLPGMTSTSLVPKSVAKSGIGFEELCFKIADNASLDNK